MSMDAPQYRHEFKYLVSAAQIPLLRSRISGFMSPDPHTGSAGTYEIRSLYFDDYHNHCFYDNENGTDPREKFRIRIYNASASRVTLECKRKEHGMTLKNACPLTPQQTQSLMQNLPLSEAEPVSPLLRKLDLLRQTELMHPVVIVNYVREPFIYADGNVRVTFDTDISSAARPTPTTMKYPRTRFSRVSANSRTGCKASSSPAASRQSSRTCATSSRA